MRVQYQDATDKESGWFDENMDDMNRARLQETDVSYHNLCMYTVLTYALLHILPYSFKRARTKTFSRLYKQAWVEVDSSLRNLI